MAEIGWPSLADTVHALARDGIAIQRKLDAAAALEDERFTTLLATLPESARPLLMPLLPSRLIVKEHHVSCTMRISTERSVEFSLVARPINLGFAMLYGKREAESSSLSVVVSGVVPGAARGVTT